MNKYLKVMAVCIQQKMCYRMNFILGFVFKMIPFIINILIWKAVYLGTNVLESTTFESYSDIVTYYILVLVVDVITSFESYKIADEIRLETLNTYLTKTIDYIKYSIAYETGGKLVMVLASGIPIFAVVALYHKYIHISTALLSWSRLLCFFISMICAYFINLFISIAINLAAFKIGQITSLFSAFYLFKNVISGQVFPLAFLPGQLWRIISISPFYYILYAPINIIMGQCDIRECISYIIWGVAWGVTLYVICKLMWKRGLEAYTANGG